MIKKGDKINIKSNGTSGTLTSTFCTERTYLLSAEVMAIEGDWAMCRYGQCRPFVVPVKYLTFIQPDNLSEQSTDTVSG